MGIHTDKIKKIAKRQKELIKEGIKYVGPIAGGVSAGVAVTNLALNIKNKKKEKERKEREIKVLENLSDRLENLGKEIKKSNKTFSLRGKNHRARDVKRPFGFVGLDTGFAKSWLTKKAEETEMGFTYYSTEDFLHEIGEGNVSINSDLRRHSVNLLFYNGVLEMLFVNPRTNEISRIDRILDSYCDKYEKETGYIATQPGNNIFHVELKTKEGTEIEIPKNFLKHNLSINVLN